MGNSVNWSRDPGILLLYSLNFCDFGQCHPPSFGANINFLYWQWLDLLYLVAKYCFPTPHPLFSPCPQKNRLWFQIRTTEVWGFMGNGCRCNFIWSRSSIWIIHVDPGAVRSFERTQSHLCWQVAVQLLDQAWGYRPCWLPSLPAPLLACPPWLGLAGTVVIRLEKYTRQRDEAETSSRLHWHLFQSLTSPRPFHHVLNEHARTLENIVLE